ncbi:unnamed protein product [Gadus morhua 'NCC']
MSIKMQIKDVAKRLHIVLFVGLYILAHCGAQPLRKRSVSEVQLMHNVWEHKHALDRQDWLQMKLGNIHTGSISSAGRPGKGPLLLTPPDSKDLSPEQITLDMNLLDLNSRHSH